MAISSVRVWRGLLLWLHVIAAVTWMSQALTLLVLLALSAVAAPGEMKVATAEVAELLDLKILGTSAITAAFTGFGLAAMTPWGFFQHWWVSTKFVLTLLQILTGTLVVGRALPSIVAAAREGSDGPVVASAVAVGLVAGSLAFQVWLSIAKPWGRTARGRRRTQTQGPQGQLSTAPPRLIATMFFAGVADIALAAVSGTPLPIFSLPVLIIALVLRRRRLRGNPDLRRPERASAATSATSVTTDVATHATATARANRVIPGVVVARTDLTSEVVSLRLAPADGSAVLPWAPGAHVDLRLASGQIRQYSLHGDTADRLGYDISVLREPLGRGASREIHELQVGSPVGIGGPRNNFPLVPAPAYVFIAGGIGITALKPMIEHVEAGGFPWQLIYRGRSRPEMAFADSLQAKYPRQAQVLPSDTAPRPDLTALLRSLPSGAAVYCCGPKTLMDAVSLAMAADCPQGTLHLERFTSTAKDDTQSRPFQVVLPRLGTIVDVSAGQGMLEALRDVLPDTPASCETGVCGSCEMRVLAGRPEHRDDILNGSDRERTDIVYPCVSRSRDAFLIVDG